MKQIYPDFYPQFHCLAGDCPDTCCKDWEVVVDEDAMAFYRTVTGELGQRLKDAFSVQDGETCFRLGDDGKCVLLTEDGLCPLQAQFGEKGLCRICASHPRFLEEYGAVQEITLCVSCPEAARLLLEHPEPVSFLTQETHEAVTTPNALDPTLYFAVRAFRDAAITLAQDRRRSVRDRLALVLLMAARAQTLLSAGKPEAVAPLCTRFLTHGTQERQLLRLRRMRRENAAFFPLWLLLRNMEHLTERFPALLDDRLLEKTAACVFHVLAVTRLFPHWDDPSPEGFRTLCGLYSKEVEHSEENLALLYRALRRGALRVGQLLSLL